MLFRYCILFVKAYFIILQTWFPVTQRCPVPSLGEIGQVVLEENNFRLRKSIYFVFLYYLPLERKSEPSLEQTWIPFTKECFLPSLVGIGTVVLEKLIKTFKVYCNNDDNNGDGKSRSEKLISAFGSVKLSNPRIKSCNQLYYKNQFWGCNNGEYISYLCLFYGYNYIELQLLCSR